jgi:quercetin dioxygenase-like cupin family protein
MSIQQSSHAFKIEPPESPSYQMLGTLWRVLATGDQTGGVVGALDEFGSHGVRAPMHVHDDADEIFYVLDGNLTFYVGAERIEAAAGAFVYLPRFVHHGFQCNSKEARVFNFLTPAGFERMIVDGGKRARYDEAPIPDDPNAKHDLPPAGELAKYGMRELPPGST